MKRVPLLCTILFSAAAAAQDKVDLTVQDGKQPLRYTIESSSKSKSETARTLDGEPQQGGRGGAAGPIQMTKSQRVVFDEGKGDEGTWRQYVSATAKTERPDDTGGVDKQEIEGALVGHRLTLVEDDRGVVVKPDTEDLSRFATLGVPGRMSFAGITPKDGVVIGGEFELGANFLQSLKSLSHPVNPALAAGQGRGGQGAQPGGRRPGRGQGADGQPQPGGDAEQPQGGQRRPRGQGGDGQDPAGGGQRRPRGQGGDNPPQGGDQNPQGGQGARGQRGAFGPGGAAGGRGAGMFGMGGGGMDATTLLANEHLEGKVTAKLVGIDGNIAKLELSGKRGGEGSIEELGLMAGRLGGGRGGQGGAGGQRGGNFPAPEGDAAAEVTLNGQLWIDVSTHQLVRLVIEGKSKQHTNLEMDMGDRGVMGIESTSEDTYRYAVHVENAPAKDDKK